MLNTDIISKSIWVDDAEVVDVATLTRALTQLALCHADYGQTDYFIPSKAPLSCCKSDTCAL